MAIRSDEITSIIKSAIDSFDSGVETRSVGTVVEVGDGIAQIYGLSGALASELLEFPGGLMGMALNLEEETVGAVILGKVVSKPVLNMIGLMLRRGRIEQLPRVAAEFRRLDNARQGITLATATSAAPLNPDEVRALTARMEQLTGGRVELDLKIDPSLLGGLVVRIGDRLIDGSVRGRLERLRNQLVSGAL